MKLFGMDLFNFKKPHDEFMYDFAQHGILHASADYGFLTTNTMSYAVKQMEPEKPNHTPLTPKKLFQLKALNDNKFAIKTDAKYLSEQIEQIKEKLAMLGKRKTVKVNPMYGIGPQEVPSENGGVRFGRLEIESILERLENRKRIKEYKKILDKYPHTTSELIAKVVSANSHLRAARAEEFVPDFPKEAINAMKEYDAMCIGLTEKKAVFYVIASHQDFEVKNKRRDPILLAQSPFGHFWQILGAWDAEMVYLADL